MPFYEVTYETGRTSVACYEDDAEAESALKAHNDRAKSGQAGGPVASHPSGVPGEPNWAAERIAAVRVYAKHPNEFNPEQTMSADVLKKEVDAALKEMSDENGVISIDQLALAVRGVSHPMQPRDEVHGSVFKMKEDKKLDMAFLEG